MKKILSALLLLVTITASAQIPYRQIGATGYDLHSKADSFQVHGVTKLLSVATGSSTDSILVKTTTGIVKKVAQSSISGSGSGTQKLFQYSAAADYDSTFQSDSLISSSTNVVRAGKEQALNDTASGTSGGYSFNSTTGTVKFFPKLLAGEVIRVYYGSYTTNILGGASLAFINFATVNSGSGASFTSGTHTLNGGSDCSNNPHDYAMGDKKIPAGQDGYVLYQYDAFTDNIILAVNTSGTNEIEVSGATHNYEAAVMIYSGTLLVYDNHTANTGAGGGAMTTGDWIRIIRTSGVTKLQTAPDASGSPGTWTDRWTFTNVSSLNSGDLWPQVNFGCFTSPANYKIYNGQ